MRKNGRNGSSTLPWSVRYKVAIGIAEVMAYLHNGNRKTCVHRDINPFSVLLSSKEAPKMRFRISYMDLNTFGSFPL